MRPRLTYANVVSTLCLFLVVAGGSAFAATQLAKNSVGTKQLKKNAVTAAKIKKDAVTTAKLADGSVTAFDIGAAQVTGPHLALGAVSNGHLAPAAVDGSKLADASVGPPKLADGAVDGSKIADGTVTRADLDPTTVGDIISAAGTLPNADGSGNVLELAGLGRLSMSCAGADTVSIFYTADPGPTQNARIYGHDPTDNEPKGAGGISGKSGGGVGYGGSAHSFAQGNLFVFNDDQVIHVDFSLVPSSCTYRLRATVDRNDR